MFLHVNIGVQLNHSLAFVTFGSRFDPCDTWPLSDKTIPLFTLWLAFGIWIINRTRDRVQGASLQGRHTTTTCKQQHANTLSDVHTHFEPQRNTQTDKQADIMLADSALVNCCHCDAWLERHRRDSSAGRASDWRSEGPRFDPGSRHMFSSVFLLPLLFLDRSFGFVFCLLDCLYLSLSIYFSLCFSLFLCYLCRSASLGYFFWSYLLLRAHTRTHSFTRTCICMP